MPRPAENRSQRRRSKWSDWIPAGLLMAGVCAIGVYLTQDAQSLQQLRETLGFGRAENRSPDADRHQTDSNDQAPADSEDLELPQFQEPASETEDTATLTNRDETPPRRFLPANRHRRTSAAAHTTLDSDTDSDPRLDRRFEADSHLEPTADVIQTADLIEPEEKLSQRATRNANRRKGSAAGIPPQRAAPFTDFNDQDPEVNDVQLTAGDKSSTPSSAGRRPGRSTPQANSPAASVTATNDNATAGAKAFDLNRIQKLIDQGQDVEAYQQLAEAYIQLPSQRPLFQKQLDEVAQRIYFSPQTQLEPPYEIQPGDQLRKIAGKYQLSWQYLSRLNQVDAKKIRAGKVLKVFQGPFEARVDLSDYVLTVMLNGQYVKRYTVGIGKMDTTPIGEFSVHEKLENPTYYGPNGMVLEANDPQNPLGERWIDIGNSFGIHGTIEPDSIGKSESAGCIRMRNEDVAEVYDFLTVGSSVRIQR